MQATPPPGTQEFLSKRLVASLATHNDDGSIHLTAVWFIFEGGNFYVATSSRSRKARNVRARPRATLMVDSRGPAGHERGVVAIGSAALVTGSESRAIMDRIHRRYMSEAAVANPKLGGQLGAMDDVTIRLTPASWYGWDMEELDNAVFGGAMKQPGNLLPLD